MCKLLISVAIQSRSRFHLGCQAQQKSSNKSPRDNNIPLHKFCRLYKKNTPLTERRTVSQLSKVLNNNTKYFIELWELNIASRLLYEVMMNVWKNTHFFYEGTELGGCFVCIFLQMLFSFIDILFHFPPVNLHIATVVGNLKWEKEDFFPPQVRLHRSIKNP